MTELRRGIRLLHATALVVGIIVGASIFVQPSEITREVGTVRGIFAVWLVAGAVTIVGALICAELSARYPETGGVYVFLRNTISPLAGFLWGWAMFWSMHTGIIAAIAVVLARYAGHFIPMSDSGTRVFAIVTIVFISFINVLGVKQGSRMQTAFTVAKLAGIVLLLIIGFVFGERVASGAATPVTTDYGGFGRALAAGLFSFGGWHMVTYTAAETHEPNRVIPRALMLGVLLVVACYIALNALYLYVLPLETVKTSTRVAADAADAVLGHGGATLMSTLVVFSAFGALAGVILAGPRVYFAMAGDRQIFGWLAGVHPRFHTPHRAIMLQAAWSSALVATGTYRALFTRVIYTEWLFFAVMAVGLMRVRRSTTSSYRMPGYPVLPLLFIGAALFVAISAMLASSIDSAIGLGIVLLGAPVYYLMAKRQG